MKREEAMTSKKPGHPTFKWLFRVHYQNEFLWAGFFWLIVWVDKDFDTFLSMSYH